MSTTGSLLLRTLSGRRPERVPFWFMRQAGRYLPEYRALRERADSFLDFCLTPQLAAEATLQPIRRFSPDGAILFADILVVPWAMGQDVAFEPGQGPVLSPVRSGKEIDRLDTEGAAARLEPVARTVERVRAALPDGTALIGFAGSPWTVAAYMVEGRGSRDFAAPRLWGCRDAAAMTRLIGKITAVTVEYLRLQIDAGAQVVQLFDSWAGVLPEEDFRRWVIGPTREIVDALRAHAPDAPIIGFPRGAGPLYADYLAETGVDAVSLDTAIPPAWACHELGGARALQGNLDPLRVVAGGQTMLDAAAGILKNLAGRPHVFNLGHGLVPETPVEHVASLADWLRTDGVVQ